MSGERGYLATITVELYVPHVPDGERVIGSDIRPPERALTSDGAALWDATDARSYLDDLNDRFAEAGTNARYLWSEVTRLERLNPSDDVELLDWRHHEVSPEAA